LYLYLFTDYGSKDFRKTVGDTAASLMPCLCSEVIRKDPTITRKANKIYDARRIIHYFSMFPIRVSNLFLQSPLLVLNIIIVGRLYIPGEKSKNCTLGNASVDVENIVKYLIHPKN